MGKSFDQFRHLDEDEYAQEIAPLSPDQLTALHGRITRKLIAASLGTAQGTLCAPLTAGMSLVPAAVGGRRINVNARRLKIIEARMAQIHAQRYQKRVRDFAIPVAVMGLSLGIAHGAESFFVEHLTNEHAIHAATVATEMGQHHFYTELHGQEEIPESFGLAAAAAAPQFAAPMGGPRWHPMPMAPPPPPHMAAPPWGPPMGPGYGGPYPPEAPRLAHAPTMDFAPPMPPMGATSTFPPYGQHAHARAPWDRSAPGAAAIPSPTTRAHPPPFQAARGMLSPQDGISPRLPPRPVSANVLPAPAPPPASAMSPRGGAPDAGPAPLTPERPASAVGHECVAAMPPRYAFPTFPPTSAPVRMPAPSPAATAAPAAPREEVPRLKSTGIPDYYRDRRPWMTSQPQPGREKMSEAPGMRREESASSPHTPRSTGTFFPPRPPPPPTYPAMREAAPSTKRVDSERTPQAACFQPESYYIPHYNPAAYAR